MISCTPPIPATNAGYSLGFVRGQLNNRHGDVLPHFPLTDMVHMRGTDPVSVGNIFRRLVCPQESAPNVLNIRNGQPVLPVAFTSQVSEIKELGTSAIDHVVGIVSCRPVVQMLRVTARWIVTVMANTKVLRHGAICQLGGDDMCPVAILPNAESAISISVAGSDVWPACVRAAARVDAAPEPLNIPLGQAILSALADTCTFPRAVLSRAEATWLDVEGRMTCFANGIRGRLRAHLMVLSSGAAPRTVPAVAGISCALIIPNSALLQAFPEVG